MLAERFGCVGARCGRTVLEDCDGEGLCTGHVFGVCGLGVVEADTVGGVETLDLGNFGEVGGVEVGEMARGFDKVVCSRDLVGSANDGSRNALGHSREESSAVGGWL